MKPEIYTSEFGKVCEFCGEKKTSRVFYQTINKKWLKLCAECWETVHNKAMNSDPEKRGANFGVDEQVCLALFGARYGRRYHGAFGKNVQDEAGSHKAGSKKEEKQEGDKTQEEKRHKAHGKTNDEMSGILLERQSS